ncbi:MAG TPA: leucine--tRNA ligase, partial [Clostridiaceae bacterium]|nr:leucine--tRNA ligase [Clostridiaceae bacterium]
TLFGASYVVFAPENAMVAELTTEEHKEEVEAYIEAAKMQSDIDRQSLSREKTGVFTGSYAVNPINGRVIPIWVGDYVLNTYGTGIVMAVPAHDERDFEFAKKYDLPIERVIEGGKELPFTEIGKMVNSGDFDGLSGDEAKEKVTAWLEERNSGALKVNYRLRDWLVSRQRYWGAPIPIVYCDKCGEVVVEEKDLPVELPYDVEFAPDGKSPLAKSESFLNTTCPKCGGHAQREADTLDTFVCSSWYYLRYVDNKNTDEPFDKAKIDKMLPVDKYVGGPEHAVMHLLYARFITKALRDMGYLSFDEPFKSLTHQGLILGPDGQKMSKSKGNTISPDEYITQYGSDVFRMYLMFGFSYSEGGAWSDEGIRSVSKFVDRVERNFHNIRDILQSSSNTDELRPEDKELLYWNANTIKGVSEDAEKMQFNTAIARMMEMTNALIKYIPLKQHNHKTLAKINSDFIRVMAPFAPHFAEEIWHMFGNETSVFDEPWPVFDESALIKDEVEIVIQINGKIKERIMIPTSASDDEIKEMAVANETIQKETDGKTVVKVIVIKGRLVNIVVKG